MMNSRGAYPDIKKSQTDFDILLSVHLSIFISVFYQLDAQNLFYRKFYFMPLHVSSTYAHHQEVKITLHSLWYRHTYRWDDTRGCVINSWPPDDEHMCSKHVEAWNKTYCETNFVHQFGYIQRWTYWDARSAKRQKMSRAVSGTKENNVKVFNYQYPIRISARGSDNRL